MTALCSGGFTPAAGVPDGRAATAHWRLLDARGVTAPRARVPRDVLFTDDEVVPPIREGGRRRYVDPPLPPRPDRAGVASTVDWAVGRPRQHAELGVTPDAYRRAVRVPAAS
ncbi:hypothetical protein [Saccharothrix saharensis]|uniref:hypothetical protein n=1 Tax=Saccharothrix saharensis TaxID=571190 RepID=UPI00114F7F51|nr:hypothetical protein [Saccharothrix saharensis]